MELLKINDDPERWEYPLGFDYESEQERFLQFATAFFAALNISPMIETGACIQDASFHSQLIFPVGLVRYHSLRFSNFGSFITINDDEGVPDEILSTILELADRFEYTYIPYQYLDADYTGSNLGVTGIDSWWIRYFDYV
ncbi:hypothetical protein FHS27_006537 [Rhodopirellula rubra]|uniref:Uncharacterized protein n=1 Tax=Aporhodopirellula rubra TaxID=980271 RepID=A0A7W5E5P3_9BACT|nr:hypothetical protein [Aporhodopirellula rubra]MBB3210689.1 hypothetical protein [Aporhodopirellula rubra]